MKSVHTLYYALGKIVFAIANAEENGSAKQKDDSELVYTILSGEARKYRRFAEAADLIKRMKKQVLDLPVAYQISIKDMERNRDKFSPEMKAFFVAVVKKIAAVFPPVTIDEQNIVDRFIEDTNKITVKPKKEAI